MYDLDLYRVSIQRSEDETSARNFKQSWGGYRMTEEITAIWNINQLTAASAIPTKSLIQLKLSDNNAKGSTSGGTVAHIHRNPLLKGHFWLNKNEKLILGSV